MNRIYLVRHGETEWNKSGRYQGKTDVPLSSTGILQAKSCAEVLRKIQIDRIVCSNLSRALLTAQTINEDRNIPLTIDKDLQELNFGDWEGLTYDEITARWPGAIEEMYSNPSTVGISNGESWPVLQERSWQAVKRELTKTEEGETLLVVCHGGTIRALLCKLLNIPLDNAWNFRQGNTAINYVDFFGEKDINVLGLLNQVDHIEGIR